MSSGRASRRRARILAGQMAGDAEEFEQGMKMRYWTQLY